MVPPLELLHFSVVATPHIPDTPPPSPADETRKAKTRLHNNNEISNDEMEYMEHGLAMHVSWPKDRDEIIITSKVCR